MKIAVLGAGALGCAIGGTLAQAGHDVVLVNRNRAHVDAIRGGGLVMRHPDGDRTVRVQAALDASGLGAMDLVIVLVKSFDTRTAMSAALNLVGPETTVLSLQNGLGHEEILAELVGREQVIGGKTYVGGVLLAPGMVLAGVAGKETLIGEFDGRDSERVRRIAETFDRAGLATIASPNILGTIWDKLLVNVATGAVSAVTRLPYGPLYRIPEIEATALAAVEEAMAVARAQGIRLAFTSAREAWLKAAAGLPENFKTSMLQSLEKGSVTEIDFINGAVVHQGARMGVSTPVNATLVACVKGIEATLARRSPSPPSTMNQPATRSFLEHVAIRVRDIHWHIRFFREVLGQELREVDGTPENPRQYWTLGGMQFMATPDFQAPPSNDSGWLAHLGVMVEDLEAALAAAKSWGGVTVLPQARNWLQLPDGLAVELIEAAPGSVSDYFRVKPRG